MVYKKKFWVLRYLVINYNRLYDMKFKLTTVSVIEYFLPEAFDISLGLSVFYQETERYANN